LVLASLPRRIVIALSSQAKRICRQNGLADLLHLPTQATYGLANLISQCREADCSIRKSDQTMNACKQGTKLTFDTEVCASWLHILRVSVGSCPVRGTLKMTTTTIMGGVGHYAILFSSCHLMTLSETDLAKVRGLSLCYDHRVSHKLNHRNSECLSHKITAAQTDHCGVRLKFPTSHDSLAEVAFWG
jgi:hypothetical protein